MKKTNKQGRLRGLCALVGAALLLAGCGAQPAPLPGGQPPDSTPPPARELRLLHRPKIGVAAYAQTEAGLYMVQPCHGSAGGINLVYLDFESTQSTVVCVRPECRHDSESCTGWFPATYGPCQAAAIGDKVYLLFYGNGEQQSETAPQLLQIEPNGAGRKQVMRFQAADTFATPFATDGESLFLMKKTVENSEENGFETTTQLQGLDLQTMEMRTLAVWETDARLWGAAQDNFYVQIPLNFDYGGSNFIAPGQGQQYKVVRVGSDGTQTELFSIEETGRMGAPSENAYYGVELKTHTVTARSFVDDSVKVVYDKLPEALREGYNASIVGSYDGVLFLSALFPPTTPEETGDAVLYAIDTQTQQAKEIRLMMTENGTPSHKQVLPLGQYQDQYLVHARLVLESVTGLGPDGEVVQYESLTPRFAMISKEDFLENRAVYREFTPMEAA